MNAGKFLKQVFSKSSKDIAQGAMAKRYADGGDISFEQASHNVPDVSHLQDVTGIDFQNPNPLNYAQGVARLADAYTGAPVRAALGAMGRGESGAAAQNKEE